MAKIDKNIERDKFVEEAGKRAFEIFRKSIKFKSQTELRLFLENKLSEATVSDFFAGKSNITIYNLWLILKALNGSADYVLFGKKQKPLLSDFQQILDQVKQNAIDIDDKDIKDLIIWLSEQKESEMSFFETLKKMRKLGQGKINAINKLIDIFLAE